MSPRAPGRPGAPDLLVVGGGPAGLGLAIRARLAGFAVRVLDRREPPIDKACGEGLMPDGLALLEELGVDLDRSACRPFRGIRYLDGEEDGTGHEEAVADGVFAGPEGAAGHGLGVRRSALHGALVARAEEVGATLTWGARVEGLCLPEDGDPEAAGDGDGLPGVRLAAEGSAAPEILRAPLVVGADGLRSRVRGWAGLDGPEQPMERARFGIRRHYRMAPWSDRVEVYWVDGAEAYVTPVGPELVGVAILWRPHGSGNGGGRGEGASGFDDLLARFPALARRLEGAPPASRDRGCGPLRQRTRGLVRRLPEGSAGGRPGNRPEGRAARLPRGVALIGDASGYVDAITGEGLSLALHQGAALVAALEAGDLGLYERRSRRLRRLPDGLTHLLLAVEARPRLRRRMIRTLAAEPELFDRILGVHARLLEPRDLWGHLGVGGLARLTWRLAGP